MHGLTLRGGAQVMWHCFFLSGLIVFSVLFNFWWELGDHVVDTTTEGPCFHV